MTTVSRAQAKFVKSYRPEPHEFWGGSPRVLLDTPPVPPFVPIEFPNPRGAAFTQDLRGFQHWTAIPADIAATPAHQTDWPNPRGHEFPSSLRTFHHWVNIVRLLNETPF